jgi:hypothetical protein
VCSRFVGVVFSSWYPHRRKEEKTRPRPSEHQRRAEGNTHALCRPSHHALHQQGCGCKVRLSRGSRGCAMLAVILKCHGGLGSTPCPFCVSFHAFLLRPFNAVARANCSCTPSCRSLADARGFRGLRRGRGDWDGVGPIGMYCTLAPPPSAAARSHFLSPKPCATTTCKRVTVRTSEASKKTRPPLPPRPPRPLPPSCHGLPTSHHLTLLVRVSLLLAGRVRDSHVAAGVCGVQVSAAEGHVCLN